MPLETQNDPLKKIIPDMNASGLKEEIFSFLGEFIKAFSEAFIKSISFMGNLLRRKF